MLGIFLMLFLSACGWLWDDIEFTPPPEPDPPTLPEATQEGLGTMGCLVDGELLLGQDNSFFATIPPVSGLIDQFSNIIIALDDEDGGQFFDIQFNAPVVGDSLPNTPVRYHVWGQPNLNITRLWLGIRNPTEETRIIAETPNNWVEFTRYEPYDGGIMSGTFAFDMIGEMGREGDTIRIREGRFDVKLVDP